MGIMFSELILEGAGCNILKVNIYSSYDIIAVFGIDALSSVNGDPVAASQSLFNDNPVFPGKILIK